MTPERWETRPRVLENEDEQEAFLSTFNTRWWTPNRDQLACRVMLEAGLRVSEVTSLKEEHVKSTPTGGEIVVRDGKGGVDRRVGIGRDLRSALDEWLERKEAEAPDCSWVFPTSNGNPIKRQHLYRTVRRAAKRAELREAEQLHPHCLRHTFATNWLKEGGDLENLRRGLGHASLQTTQKYLQLVDDAHVREMQERANGGEKKTDSLTAEELGRTAAEEVPEQHKQVVRRAVTAAIQATQE